MLKTTKLALFFFIILASVSNAAGQDENSINTYSPYTLYGIGDVRDPGFVNHQGMGGITIGTRDRRVINYNNPASLSVRDTLSFLFDFGIRQKNMYSRTANERTSSNNLNVDYMALSFRIAKGLGVSAGFMPFSDVGYDISFRETDPSLINEMGDVLYQFKGEGGINKAFLGVGLSFGKHISLGGNLYYYFGNINRHYNILFNSNPYYTSLLSSDKVKTGKVGYSAGVQYKTTVDGVTLVIGGTYRPETNLASSVESLKITNVGDTTNFTSNSINNFFNPNELGLGFTLAKEFKFTLGMDYIYQDWTGFNIVNDPPKSLSFKTDKNHTLRLGGEYTPNAFDIKSALNRLTYRGGLYYTRSYMILNDTRINDFGITFGVGIPISRKSATNVNTAITVGQRGTTSNGLIKENYVTFSLSASMYELWFRRYKYD